MFVARIDAYTSLWGKALLAWLALAVVAVVSGALASAPTPALPALIATLTAATLVVLWRTPGGRAWSGSVPLERLAWFHAWRVVPGVAFLVLYAKGALPWGFAVPGGIGDVAIALLAPLAGWAVSRGRAGRAAFAVWSVLGALDLAGVLRAAFVICSPIRRRCT